MLVKAFEEFCRVVKEKKLAVEGVAIADENEILLERHFTADKPRDIYSNTKSFMATAVGMAIGEGKLTLEAHLSDLLGDALSEEARERLYPIQLKHLLTMTSGFGDAYLMMKERRAGVGVPDYLAYMAALPLKEQPGTRFCYSTADSILAGMMVERAIGKNLALYLYDHLFKPMGTGFPIWETSPCGHTVGGSGLQLKLGDMIKLGQLYLADGMWKGERLLDSKWIAQATRKQIETNNGAEDIWNCGYGYQFWMSPYPGSYRADGSFGQVTTVLPKAGLVVALQCPEEGCFENAKTELHERVLSQL